MPKDSYRVSINRPIKTVFNYIATPAWWPLYHPTSRTVEPSVLHSLRVGESAVETCVLDPFGLLKFVIRWTGMKNNGSTLFQMEGKAEQFGGAEGTITYSLTEEDGVTSYERVFEYEMDGIFGRLLQSRRIGVVTGLIYRDGRDSLENVKMILESTAPLAANYVPVD